MTYSVEQKRRFHTRLDRYGGEANNDRNVYFG